MVQSKDSDLINDQYVVKDPLSILLTAVVGIGATVATVYFLASVNLDGLVFTAVAAVAAYFRFKVIKDGVVLAACRSDIFCKKKHLAACLPFLDFLSFHDGIFPLIRHPFSF
ncbi:MAG: hypothetical protein WCS96_15250, partial [Victivallales bacterium]